MTKLILTAAQKAERRLWRNADKACRALMEHVREGGVVRIGYLTFNVRDGISLGLTYNLSLDVKEPKQKSHWKIKRFANQEGDSIMVAKHGRKR